MEAKNGPSHVLRGSPVALQCACFDGTGNHVVAGDQQGDVCVWNMRTRRAQARRRCASASTWRANAPPRWRMGALTDPNVLFFSACGTQEGVIQVQRAPGDAWIRCATPRTKETRRRGMDEAHLVLTGAAKPRHGASPSAKGGGERYVCGDGGRTGRWNRRGTTPFEQEADSAKWPRREGNGTSASHSQEKTPAPSTCGTSMDASRRARSEVEPPRRIEVQEVQACA